MGVAFCVVFKTAVQPYGTLGGDSIALVNGYEKLDALAEKKGLRTLGSFLSQDPSDLADIMEEMDMDAAEELGLPPEEWFSPNDGLAAVQALIAYLRDQPKALKNGKAMLSELQQVETELAAAKRAKVKFHFSLVP